ncbi:MAG: hypothetical protein U5O39_00465 [Gammaproteobacteria bacterium]|nr:hypothetical protein [Gammaproteobacteria bacterium]
MIREPEELSVTLMFAMVIASGAVPAVLLLLVAAFVGSPLR